MMMTVLIIFRFVRVHVCQSKGWKSNDKKTTKKEEENRREKEKKKKNELELKPS